MCREAGENMRCGRISNKDEENLEWHEEKDDLLDLVCLTTSNIVKSFHRAVPVTRK